MAMISIFSFPIRTEIEVLGPDNPNDKVIGWSVYEKLGYSNLKIKIVYKCC